MCGPETGLSGNRWTFASIRVLMNSKEEFLHTLSRQKFAAVNYRLYFIFPCGIEWFSLACAECSVVNENTCLSTNQFSVSSVFERILQWW